jgi:DNA topoisomerase-1
VGRDDRGRKQYRYHPRWRAVRDETKYEKMIDFGHALPKIRAKVNRHLKLAGVPREKVLAAVIRTIFLSHEVMT